MRFNIIKVWLQVIEIESALSSALSAYFAEPLRASIQITSKFKVK